MPESDREPIDIALADRTVPVAPGETCILVLTDQQRAWTG
ncbi:putative glycosyl hydrolase [Streptomyces alboflavus]|uniref:Putative glycosyl hydrolase n=1 Tax=Streptomyces alboflavus TaxID=67267 RepID=A0A1Z1WQF0_9ACTN|nr:putative glycosyl hydrolase [Streptomyces alboflavus]